MHFSFSLILLFDYCSGAASDTASTRCSTTSSKGSRAVGSRNAIVTSSGSLPVLRRAYNVDKFRLAKCLSKM